MPLTTRYVARSEVGLVRDGNEDSGYAGPRVLAVADGVGGHAAGEIASSVAIDALSAIDGTTPTSQDGYDPRSALTNAVREASDRMRTLIKRHPRLESMGTTVTAALWTGETFVFAHLGDSRAYLLHNGELHRITHDHTYVQALIDEGRLTEDEVTNHPARSLILRILDGRSDPEIDFFTIEVAPRDRVLLCSDGLTAVVDDDALAEALSAGDDVKTTAAHLVDLAYAGGAPDNVTVVVVDIVEADQPRNVDDTAEAFVVGAAAEQHRESDGSIAAPTVPVADAEEATFADKPVKRSRWVWRGLAAALAAVLLWGAAAVAYAWTQRQYYVGNHDGNVAIYRGVSQQLGPLDLSHVYETVNGLPVRALSPLYREELDQTIVADSLDQAREIVARLRRMACRTHSAAATPSPATPTTAPTTPVDPAAPQAPAPTTTDPAAAAPGMPTPPVPQPSPGPETPAAPAPATSPTPTPTATETVPGLSCDEVTQ
jgi:serine/threonine protein phosphatase PrpC